jgi:hypothetical protein
MTDHRNTTRPRERINGPRERINGAGAHAAIRVGGVPS